MAGPRARVWDPFLSPRDREIYALSGWGQGMGFGRRPVVLVVDCNYAFCGDRREPIAESIRRWPTSCGDVAWAALDGIASLLGVARSRRVPVVYTTGAEAGPEGFGAGRWRDKLRRVGAPDPERLELGNTIVPLIAPRREDIVIRKGKPSAFFGTPLIGFLVDLQADAVIVCGGVTSGCVRSTVLDAFSYNLRVAVVEECTFDRFEASHAIDLFDMDAKYADVVGLDAVLEHLGGLPEGLFDERMPALRRRIAVGA
jgi:nicotinamidase-related amidase